MGQFVLVTAEVTMKSYFVELKGSIPPLDFSFQHIRFSSCFRRSRNKTYFILTPQCLVVSLEVMMKSNNCQMFH